MKIDEHDIIYCKQQLLEKVRKLIDDTIRESFKKLTKTDFLDLLLFGMEHNNCTKCQFWNYGRRYWRCIKGHNIRTYSFDDVPLHYDRREIIPFIESYANNGCPDYKPIDLYKHDIIQMKEYLSLKEEKK